MILDSIRDVFQVDRTMKTLFQIEDEAFMSGDIVIKKGILDHEFGKYGVIQKVDRDKQSCTVHWYNRDSVQKK